MVSKKFNIRITLDRFLQSGEIINYRFVTNKIDLKNLIFEMKYENKYDNFVKNNLMHNYRLSKNSKFINSLYNSGIKNFCKILVNKSRKRNMSKKFPSRFDKFFSLTLIFQNSMLLKINFIFLRCFLS